MAELNIVLFEPEIPANTGNIGRTCVATGTRLHLIEPLGFRLNDKTVKRAGMDYWEHLDVTRYDDWEDFLERNPDAKIYFATTKAKRLYYVWKRKCRDTGRNPDTAPGTVYTNSYDWRDSFLKSFQLCCHCIV